LELFDNRIVRPDVSNYYSDVGFLYTAICDDSNAIGVYLRCPKAWLRFWRCWYKSLSDEEEGKWKLILLEK